MRVSFHFVLSIAQFISAERRSRAAQRQLVRSGCVTQSSNLSRLRQGSFVALRASTLGGKVQMENPNDLLLKRFQRKKLEINRKGDQDDISVMDHQMLK